MKATKPSKQELNTQQVDSFDFTILEREPLLFKRLSSSPFKDIQLNNAENIPPTKTAKSPPNQTPYLPDKSITTRVQTNQIYESVRVPQTNQNIIDWQIKTIRQLRREKTSRRGDLRQSGSRGRKGIHVSVSRNKRKTVTEGRVGLTTGRETRSGKQAPHQYECLRRLSTRGRLTDKIQIEMDQNQKQGLFFC